MEIILIILILIVIHGYGGYTLPIIVNRLIHSRKTKGEIGEVKKHSISIVIAAYNEETCIAEKIINTLSIDYPKTLLDIIIVTDGSNDRTFEIASSYDSVRCFHENSRKGKMAAIDRIMP